jgi:hypothetical protein
MIEPQTLDGHADTPSELAWVLAEHSDLDHSQPPGADPLPHRMPTFFMHTPFAPRLLGLFLHARRNRSWHVPHALTGSGKSTAIRELLRCSPGEKHRDGQVHMPIVAMRAPNRDEPGVRDFGKKLARQFGVIPGMPWDEVRPWMLNQFYDCGIEQLIVDDAHECSKAQFGYIKELTDDLEGPPFYRRISVCLVCVSTQNIVPLREMFGQDKDTWVQFSRRLDKRHPYPRIADQDRQEVQVVLAGLDVAHHDRLAGLVLQRHAGVVYRGLTGRTVDPYADGAVTMDNLVKLGELVVDIVESTCYVGGEPNGDRQVIQAALELLKQNRLAPTLVAGAGILDSVARASLTPLSARLRLTLRARSKLATPHGQRLCPIWLCRIQMSGYWGSCCGATWPMRGLRAPRPGWWPSPRSRRAREQRRAASSRRRYSTWIGWVRYLRSQKPQFRTPLSRRPSQDSTPRGHPEQGCWESRPFYGYAQRVSRRVGTY